MSGGAFEYKQYVIQEIIDRIEREIEKSREYPFSPETITEFYNGARYLLLAQIYAQRIDWLVSGDDGEDDFHRRLAEDKDEALGFV
jgi:hypothetical protein